MKLLRLNCASYKTQVKRLPLGTSPVLWCLPHPSLALFTQRTSGPVLINDCHAFLLSRWEPVKVQTLLVPCGGPNVWSLQAINEWESNWWMDDRWLKIRWSCCVCPMALVFNTGSEEWTRSGQLHISRMTHCHTKHDTITSPQEPHQDEVTNILSPLSYQVSCSHHSETSWWSSRFHPQASGSLPPGVQIGTFGPLLCGTGFC